MLKRCAITLFIIFWMTGQPCLSNSAEADNTESLTNHLCSPTSISVYIRGPRKVFEYLSLTLNIDFQIDPDVFRRKSWRDTPKYLVIVSEVQPKYVISWMLFFAKARGKVEGNTVTITTQSKLQANDLIFECYKETSGPWVENLMRSLENSVSLHLNSVPVVDVIRMISRVAGLSVIADSGGLPDNALWTRVSVKAEHRSSGEVLRDVLNQANLTFKIQGGVILITKEKKGELPNS